MFIIAFVCIFFDWLYLKIIIQLFTVCKKSICFHRVLAKKWIIIELHFIDIFYLQIIKNCWDTFVFASHVQFMVTMKQIQFEKKSGLYECLNHIKSIEKGGSDDLSIKPLSLQMFHQTSKISKHFCITWITFNPKKKSK